MNFIIEDAVDFQSSSSLDPTETSVYQISGVNPTYFPFKEKKKSYISNCKITNIYF